MITREMIEDKVRLVLHEDDIPEWWEMYLPTFRATADSMFQSDPEKLLIYVESYIDASFG